MEERILVFLQEVFEVIGWVGVVITMGLEIVLIPMPSEVIMPLSGWMLVKERGLGEFYTLLAGFYGALGNLWGQALVYWIGFKWGRAVVLKYGKYVLLTPADLKRAEDWFDKYGAKAVFFSRFVPVVRSLVSLPAGTARMNFAKFLIYTFSGSFLWCWGLAFGGYLLGENWGRIREITHPFDLLILLLLVSFIAFYFYRRIRELKDQIGS